MSYAFENGITRHNIDDLAFKHLNHTNMKFKDLVGSGKKEITFDYVNIKDATSYAAEDAFITFKLFNIFSQILTREKNNFVYQKIDKPLIKVLASMENYGVKKIFEIGPGNVLTGLVKRITKNIECFSIQNPEDMDNLI